MSNRTSILLAEALAVVRSRSAAVPSVGVVLGSGLGSFARKLQDATAIPYADIPGMSPPTAEGHAGKLVLGTVGGAAVACLAGRLHQYEGHSAEEVVFGVRLLEKLGVKALLLTNATGGIDPSYEPGTLVAITDHLNLQGSNPLIGPNDDALGPRFPDMSVAYCPALRILAHEAAKETQVELREGVYAGLLGPSFETPAEIRMLRALGADMVGMSTVPEVIAANHMGVRCVGISCVTNLAAGLSGQALSHQEVLETGEQVREKFERLLAALLPRMARAA